LIVEGIKQDGMFAVKLVSGSNCPCPLIAYIDFMKKKPHFTLFMSYCAFQER
jgi:hypothetical protein